MARVVKGCRVYVHGVGAVTALGATWAKTLRALAEGQCAIFPVSKFDATGFPCTVGAEVNMDCKGGQDLRVTMGAAAAKQAWADAKIDVDPERIGVFVGAESGRPSFATLQALARAAGDGNTFCHERFGGNEKDVRALLDEDERSPAAVASHIARMIAARGPVRTVSLACASGSAAIVEGARAIAHGLCDVAVCGGVGADIDAFFFAAFSLLGALSERGVSRPFDAQRDGFVLGEGASMVVLAGDAGAVELAGAGRTTDAHHLTAPDPSGHGAARAMRLALSQAGLSSVDYVQAHGTSTPLNDAAESQAIRDVLGDTLEQTPVSSVKGALGHWIAGAGAIGLLCAIESVTSGTIVPTVGLSTPGDDCALLHVKDRAIKKNVSAALANSFGFGGANCSLVVRRAS